MQRFVVTQFNAVCGGSSVHPGLLQQAHDTHFKIHITAAECTWIRFQTLNLCLKLVRSASKQQLVLPLLVPMLQYEFKVGASSRLYSRGCRVPVPLNWPRACQSIMLSTGAKAGGWGGGSGGTRAVPLFARTALVSTQQSSIILVKLKLFVFAVKQVDLRCLQPAAGAGDVCVVVVDSKSSAPLMSALVRMPLSEPEEV